MFRRFLMKFIGREFELATLNTEYNRDGGLFERYGIYKILTYEQIDRAE